jgi:hypothetical protein
MVREIGENFYRTSHFQFEDRFDLIPKFRVTDQWKLGFIPVAFVSNVEVSLKCNGEEFEKIEEVEEEEVNGGPWIENGDNTWGAPPASVASHDTDRRTIIPRSAFLVHLESLFGFKPGTNLTIKIGMGRYKQLTAYERQELLCESVVPFIFPTLLRLRDTGLRVRFVLAITQSKNWERHEQVFTSAWNPASAQELTKNFFEVRTIQARAEVGAKTNAHSTSTVSKQKRRSSSSGQELTRYSVVVLRGPVRNRVYSGSRKSCD